MTPKQREMRARIAGITMHAKRGSANAPATEGLLRKFEREVDPEQELRPEERRKRAIQLRRAHMLSLALRSSVVRAERRLDAGAHPGDDSKHA
jgi:hypothetical protein